VDEKGMLLCNSQPGSGRSERRVRREKRGTERMEGLRWLGKRRERVSVVEKAHPSSKWLAVCTDWCCADAKTIKVNLGE
jgi:hypothetical protein